MTRTLDQHIIAAYRASIGRQPLDNLPDAEEYLAAFAEDPELLAAARAEAARLDQVISARSQGSTHTVEEERRRRSALALMLGRFEAEQGKKAAEHV